MQAYTAHLEALLQQPVHQGGGLAAVLKCGPQSSYLARRTWGLASSTHASEHEEAQAHYGVLVIAHDVREAWR